MWLKSHATPDCEKKKTLATLRVGNIEHRKFGNGGVVLQQKRQGLTNAARAAQNGNLERLLVKVSEM